MPTAYDLLTAEGALARVRAVFLREAPSGPSDLAEALALAVDGGTVRPRGLALTGVPGRDDGVELTGVADLPAGPAASAWDTIGAVAFTLDATELLAVCVIDPPVLRSDPVTGVSFTLTCLGGAEDALA